MLRTGRDLSVRGRRRLRDSPGCCAVGRDLSERGRHDLSGRVARPQRRWGFPRGGGTVGRLRAVMPNPTITQLASRLDQPDPGPPHRHAPEPAHATVGTSVGRREPTLGRPRLLNPSQSVSRREHPTTTAARATGHGSPHLQRMGSRDRRLRRRLRDSPGRLRRRARPQRTGRRRLRDSPGCSAPGATSANETGATSANGAPRPQRTGRRDLSEPLLPGRLTEPAGRGGPRVGFA
ncbi:hypothetical protein TESS_TESS_01316 [Tessaracoccus sp. O5.2]